MNFITRAGGIGLIIWGALQLCLPAAPVSYGRQIAPMFAFHCAGCHGVSNPSSNLELTRFASLRAGGNIGDEIVPGHPEKSILLDFVEGKRGPRQRMPQNSRPLSPAEVSAIREWIKEGAQNDGAAGPCFELRLARLPASTGKTIQIRSRITAPALIVLSVRDPRSGRELFVDEGSVNSPKEAANLGAPGDWMSLKLTAEEGWPSSVELNLRIQYASVVPNDSVLIAVTDGNRQSTSKLLRSVCGPL